MALSIHPSFIFLQVNARKDLQCAAVVCELRMAAPIRSLTLIPLSSSFGSDQQGVVLDYRRIRK